MVNGDKTYDSETERFYYVTDMDDSTAVLIYYNNVEKGKPSNSKFVAYDSSGENFHGPRTAIEELPSTSEWRNVSLKNSVKAILNENGGNTTKGETLPSNFSYSGKAARLLTIQEVRKAHYQVILVILEKQQDYLQYRKLEKQQETKIYQHGKMEN